jgi:DNA processing protein
VARIEQIELLALLRCKGAVWSFVARETQRPGGLERLIAGEANEQSPDAVATLAALRKRDRARDDQHVSETIERAVADGYRLTTVLDEDYPVNLRSIVDLPPMLFYRGELREDDARSVAVVGTREASAEGLRRATQMARLLAERDVTVLSGLARGIDTAAHRAALDAGGRTIAVLGCGIRRMYPPENADLADEIAEHGAVVSQFWPDMPPARHTFPRRNIVTSGLGQGTVVIEASATSGAKMQAGRALAHGKRLFLLDSLVATHPWAKNYSERPGATIVRDVGDVTALLDDPVDLAARSHDRRQLELSL